jgi:hypothetical protein
VEQRDGLAVLSTAAGEKRQPVRGSRPAAYRRDVVAESQVADKRLAPIAQLRGARTTLIDHCR